MKRLKDLGSLRDLFNRNKDFIGLEVDAGEIRAVELTPEGEGFRVVASAVLPGPELGPGGVPDEKSLAEALQELSDRGDFSARQVVSVLPGTVVIERLVHLPSMPARELEAAVRWEAEQLIPVPLDNMILRHVILGESTGTEKKLDVLVAAAPQDSVYRFHQAFAAAGLTLAALDLPALALWRFFCGPGKSGWCQDRQIIADINATVTRCVVVEGGRLLFTRTVPVGCREIGLYPSVTPAGVILHNAGEQITGDGDAGESGMQAGKGAAPDQVSYAARELQEEAAVSSNTAREGAAGEEDLEYLLSPLGYFAQTGRPAG
ncbi:MAG TPA: pilus assembly protein PilM, partial [Desulfotomaculum sp.]|nr:pilus assembly protein PilM [Desulfotomaculum sp.]